MIKKATAFITKRIGILLSGRFFKDKRAQKNIPYFVFLYTLIILYISLGYFAEGLVKKISKQKIELKEKRAAYISVKSELMELTKQSNLAKQLENLGSSVVESTIPPKKIKIDS